MAKTLKFDNGVVNLGTSVSWAVGAISAGANSVGAGTVVFSNSNGVTFGLNGSTVTASIAAGGGGGAGISAGTQSVSTGTVVFSNSNGITFGMSGSSRVTASHNGLTAGIQSLSAGTTRATAGEVVFSNSNGLTFGLNGATITGSYTVPSVPAETPFGISAGTQSVSTGTMVFSNSNNVTFGMSGSSRITASASFPAETPFGVSAGTQSVSTGTVVWANSNGITFGMSGSNQITASHNGITSQSNQQISAYAAGNSTQSSSGTFNASSIVFRGDGVASVGVSNGSVIVSVPAGGGGLTNINVSGGTTSNNLSNLVFSNSNGVSFGLNGSTITASAEGGGAGVTLNGTEPYEQRVWINGQAGQGTLRLDPVQFPAAVAFDRALIPIYNSNSSNSSGSHTLSFWVGLYTQNASTLSLWGSASATTALTHSGTVGSYSLFSGGPRLFSIGWTTTAPASNYWLAYLSRTTSGGANGTYSHFLVSAMNSNFLGHFGASANATQQLPLGQGFHGTTQSSMINSIAFSQIQGTGSVNQRTPIVFFANGTVP